MKTVNVINPKKQIGGVFIAKEDNCKPTSDFDFLTKFLLFLFCVGAIRGLPFAHS